MCIRRLCAVSMILFVASFGTCFQAAAQAEHGTRSKYAGQEKRAIKSLSPGDLEELRRAVVGALPRRRS